MKGSNQAIEQKLWYIHGMKPNRGSCDFRYNEYEHGSKEHPEKSYLPHRKITNTPGENRTCTEKNSAKANKQQTPVIINHNP